MGSIERRIEELEKLYQRSSEEVEGHVSSERLAEIRERFRRVCEKAEREEEAGDLRRHLALQDLKEAIRKRAYGS